MAFTRYLSEEMINALNEEYRREAGWWRVLADHPDTLIAIRNNCVNVYRNGCSIAQVEQNKSSGRLDVSVHYKFLLKKNIENPYISCADGSPGITRPDELLFHLYVISAIFFIGLTH